MLRPRAPTALAMVLGLGTLPILAGSACAQPTARSESQQSAVSSLTKPPFTVQSKPRRIASTSATLQVQTTRGDPGVWIQLAALPRQDSTPAPPRPRPDLSSKQTFSKSAQGPRVMSPFGRLPVGFIENKGQVDGQAKFYLHAGSQTLWLTSDGIVFDFLRAKPPESPSPLEGEGAGEGAPISHARLTFAQDFVGASKGVRIEAGQPLPGTYNYFPRSDPATWRTKVKAYREIIYRDLWEGVDLKLSGNGRDLEQEFIIKPGADPSRIQIAYRGIEGLHLAEDGALLIQTAFGALSGSAPRIHQEINGKRVEVTGRFKLHDKNAYAFEVRSYQPQYALLIDPSMTYSTYLGGSSRDQGFGIAVDDWGNGYVTGFTGSTKMEGDAGGIPPVRRPPLLLRYGIRPAQDIIVEARG